MYVCVFVLEFCFFQLASPSSFLLFSPFSFSYYYKHIFIDIFRRGNKENAGIAFAGAANVGIFLERGREKGKGEREENTRQRDIFFAGSQIDFPFPQLSFPGIFIRSIASDTRDAAQLSIE